MSVLKDLRAKSEMDRRRFLHSLGVFLGAPLVPSSIQIAANEWLFGKAEARRSEENPPTFFLEINLRDQWDFGHVMVSPGLAAYPNLIRGSKGRKCALFYTQDELKHFRNGVYLTGDSLCLAPHLDSIAMLELCEMPMGTIHGHEAANAIRSPGRGYWDGPGRLPMWLRDPKTKIGGNEDHYGTVPTPATLHNYLQKKISPNLANGMAFKGVSRAEHTVYHFGADLPESELDRYQSVDSLVRAMSLLDSVVSTSEEADLIVRFLNKIDKRFLADHLVAAKDKQDHLAHLSAFRRSLHHCGGASPSLQLTEEERAYWSTGVPDQIGPTPKANIWLQCALAAKLMTSGTIRTAALEFDYLDVHDERSEFQMRTQAKQTAIPLSRLIETFKAAGIYDRTLIAMYTLDGSRAPAANSFGSEGKNGLILAGGMIRGGYYGDVTVGGLHADGHWYRYHRPDDSGQPVPSGAGDNSGRVSGADVWRTVMKALETPDSLAASFADSAGGRPLSYLLKRS